MLLTSCCLFSGALRQGWNNPPTIHNQVRLQGKQNASTRGEQRRFRRWMLAP